LLPPAYMIGFIRALLVGLFDLFLFRGGIHLRPLWCSLFGFAMSFLPLLTSMLMGFIHGPFHPAIRDGAVPGALCAFIADRFVQQRDRTM
jgi:hypothetical protein